MKAVLPALARPLIEPHLPPVVEPAWFTSPAEANAMIADAAIAWVDMQPTQLTAAALRHAGPGLRWVNTIYAGLDAFPVDLLAARGVTLTNGVGINANAVAEYAVMATLVAAKRFDMVVRMADRREWPLLSPGTIELAGTHALVIGLGTIGALIAARLRAFDVRVTGVTRSGRDATLTPDQSRPRLAEFDWVILAAPSTGETKAMIAAAELAAMRPSAWLVNIARGDMIDQAALAAALRAGRIAGAFLDPTTPEPLPADDPIWSTPNMLLSMHLSGRATNGMFRRGVALFLKNLAAFVDGRAMTNVVDLRRGY